MSAPDSCKSLAQIDDKNFTHTHGIYYSILVKCQATKRLSRERKERLLGILANKFLSLYLFSSDFLSRLVGFVSASKFAANIR